MIRRIVGAATALFIGLGLAATPSLGQDVKVPYIKETVKTLRFAHGLTTGSPYDMGANRLAELVETYTRGEIKVKIFPHAQLGREQDTAKDVQLGTLDITLIAINNSSMWYRPLDIFIMPFIFRDRVHANAVINGPVGKELFENYRKASGIRILTIFEWGDRAIMNKIRPINRPADLKGIKIRVPKNPVMVDTYNAFGANATAIDWGELYSALQQGLADGLEGPPQGMIDMKFYDFLKNYSYINVWYGTSVVLINDKIFAALSPENQDALLRAGKEAGEYQRWVSTVSHVTGLTRLREKGVKVNVVKDRQAFVDLVKPVWAKYKDKIGEEWFTKVLNAK
ncbi:MAG: TRAP transporter substrate-binding protein [Phycisphaerae bacterium]|jgi:tripartite ATP-independent transporter DctP family solute receptor